MQFHRAQCFALKQLAGDGLHRVAIPRDREVGFAQQPMPALFVIDEL